MHINLNQHRQFFAMEEKPEVEKKTFHGTGEILQLPYREGDSYILFIDFFSSGGRRFVKLKSYSGRVGDRINVKGVELRNGTIEGKQL